jgi:preprotein translocase subunit SecA
LIISGQQKSTDKYYHLDRIPTRLKRDTDYTVDEKTRSVALTEESIAKAERLMVSIISTTCQYRNLTSSHSGAQSACVVQKDVDYVVNSGEVIIVDEFTGRLMPGRRYSDGLHQALEAKEGLKVANENQTLASITFQNYFHMYEKLAG